MRVKMTLTVKKTASCVFQLVHILDKGNEKRGPLLNHGPMNLQTNCLTGAQYIG